jgi:hypothetical protein
MYILELFESADPVAKLKTDLLSNKEKILAVKDDNKKLYNVIDHIMQSIAKDCNITGKELHDRWVKRYGKIPDKWILDK